MVGECKWSEERGEQREEKRQRGEGREREDAEG